LAAIEKYAVQQNAATNTGADKEAIKDTVPKNISANSEKNTDHPLDDALCVVNGKIVGTLKTFSDKYKGDSIIFSKLSVLNKQQAIAKYGEPGKNGAVEMITTWKTTQSKNDGSGPRAYSKKDDKIFTQVENEPKFPGGDSAWRHYLEKNLNPGIPVDNGAPEGTYKVIVKFIVNIDGSISDVQAETKHGYGMDSAAVALIKKGPSWVPAIQNGRNVTAYKKQPITFVLEAQ
jgi:hypothetical protein